MDEHAASVAAGRCPAPTVFSPMPPRPSSRDPWWRTASFLIMGGAVGVVVLASLLTISDAWMGAHGYVARRTLADVRAADFYSTALAGDCNHAAGLVRVLTLNRAEKDVIATWWHEATHCLWLPSLPGREVEMLQAAYVDVVRRNQTDAPDWNEWAAVEVGRWCTEATGHPSVYRVLRRPMQTYCRLNVTEES